MDQTQQVTVSLQLLLDPRSGQAFEQITKAARQAADKSSKEVMTSFARSQAELGAGALTATRLGFSGFAGSMANAGTVAQGLHDIGAARSAALLSKAAAPVAVIAAGFRGAEVGANLAYDRYSTTEQLGRTAFREVIPGGERIQRFIDAMSGRTAGFEQAGIEGNIYTAESQRRLSGAQFGLSFNPQQQGLNARSLAFLGQRAITQSVQDRTTSAGELAYREEARILPLKQAEARAEREATVASRERVAAQAELIKITQRTNDLTRERARLTERLERPGAQSGVTRQELLKRIEAVNQEIGGNVELQRAGGESVLGARRREAVTTGERDRARLRRELEGEAGTLEGRVQIAQGAAERLGSMNVFDRRFGLEAARIVKQMGTTEGVPEDILAAAKNFAPEYIRQIERKTGAGSDEFKAGFKEFGAADFGTLDLGGDSRRAQELRNKLAEGEFKIDASVAEQIAEYGRNFGRFVADILEQLLAKARAEILNSVRLGRNER